MSLRIRWQVEDESGAFPLRTHALHLLWNDGELDVVTTPPLEQDGLSISPPDPSGKLELTAYGGLQFLSQDRTFRSVRLPIGGRVEFEMEDWKGSLYADGEKIIHDPLLGKVLGGHKLLSRLGAGAVGVVYRALQIDLDREVALKMLNAEASKIPLAVASFRREAKAAGGLSHPHLVQVYNVGKEDGYNYYTMELAPGGDFEGQLKERGTLPWREAASAVKDCATALGYAEENGLVHRDVKPENLMIGAGGVVKLADLGLATTRGMLDKEAAGGTPHFMAPEAVGKGKAQHASDIYSLGCSLYRLITGETVFEGNGVKEILLSHRDEIAPSLKDCGFDVPKELEELLASMLAKSVEDRPEHASEVAEELQGILQAQGGSKKALLIAIPVIAFGAWAAIKGFDSQDPENTEPERVIEYVESGDGAEAQAALLVAEEKSNFFEAMNAVEGPDRTASLESFLQSHPDGAFAQQARDEISRLADLAAQAALTTQPTEDELAKAKALDEAAQKVRSAMDQNQFGHARDLARLGPLATETEMLRLATLVDELAAQRFTEWEQEHLGFLDAQAWQEAQSLRDTFAGSIGETPPPEWTQRLQALSTSASAAVLATQELEFLNARRDFIQGAGAPVRDAVKQMDFASAKILWLAAASNSPHEGLKQAANAEADWFDLAETGMESFRRKISTQESVIREPKDQRQAKVLGLSSAGIRIQVQVSGSRVERTDPWELYQSPEQLAALLDYFAADAGLKSEAGAIYLLVAFDDLARQLQELGDNFNAGQAGIALARIQEWTNHIPVQADIPAEQIQVFQAASDLCQAILHENDYLALSRLEDLQGSFGFLATWTTQGDCAWGLKP